MGDANVGYVQLESLLYSRDNQSACKDCLYISHCVTENKMEDKTKLNIAGFTQKRVRIVSSDVGRFLLVSKTADGMKTVREKSTGTDMRVKSRRRSGGVIEHSDCDDVPQLRLYDDGAFPTADHRCKSADADTECRDNAGCFCENAHAQTQCYRQPLLLWHLLGTVAREIRNDPFTENGKRARKLRSSLTVI